MSTKSQKKTVIAGSTDAATEIARLEAELQSKRELFAKQQADLASKQKEMVLALPKQFGVKDIPEVLRLITKITGTSKRSVVTDDTRSQVKALSAAGKTGQEIADALGVSVPTIQNIRKRLGLVKARKVTAPAAPATPVPEVPAPAPVVEAQVEQVAAPAVA